MQAELRSLRPKVGLFPVRRNVLVRITIALILVILAVFLTRAPRALGIRVTWFGVIQKPVGDAMIAATAWIDAIGQTLRNPNRLTALERDVGNLRASRASLERELVETQALLTERGVAYSRQLGALREAHVVAATFTPSAQTMTVEFDRGDPIARDQPVMAGGTFIGTIIASGTNRAVIRLLGDPRTRFAVERAGATGTLGILEPDPGGGLIVSNIPTDRPIAPGVSVVTGALHAPIPSGLPIGVVTEVRRDPDGFFQTAAVDPNVDPRRQSVVTILVQPGTLLTP